jgi:uncharacterized protein
MGSLYEREAGRGRFGSGTARKVQFVVKTSKFGNLCSRQCSVLPDIADPTVLLPAQLERMYRSIADHYYRHDGPVLIEFDWHGGEPLLLSPGFYWQTFDEQTKIFKDDKISVRNYVQTNLTILNEPLVKLLKEGFDGVGVSFDLFSGLPGNSGGRDSQPTVLKNMDRLHEAGVSFGCITVLSRQNRAHLRKIFHFFAEAAISHRILPLHRGAYEFQNDDQLPEEEVLQAFIELFDLWLESPAPIIVEPIYSYTEDVLSALSCNNKNYYDKRTWESIYIVDTDGNLYSYADTFGMPLSHGNLADEAMHTIVGGTRHLRAIEAAELRIKAICPDCKHYGRACTGYPMAEESPVRSDPKPVGQGAACTRERGILDYIEWRLLELGIISSTGKLNRRSKYFPRFEPTLKVPV